MRYDPTDSYNIDNTNRVYERPRPPGTPDPVMSHIEQLLLMQPQISQSAGSEFNMEPGMSAEDYIQRLMDFQGQEESLSHPAYGGAGGFKSYLQRLDRPPQAQEPFGIPDER